MSFEISILSALIQKQAVADLEKCNDHTARFGLKLSQRDVVELVDTRSLALYNNGRIEFGGGVIEKIVREFCDSPHLSMYNYAETLHDLIEMFYYYKNETLGLISDDDLIKFMKKSYNGICQGSLELLSGRELARMARNVRFGYDPDFREDSVYDEDVENGEY